MLEEPATKLIPDFDRRLRNARVFVCLVRSIDMMKCRLPNIFDWRIRRRDICAPRRLQSCIRRHFREPVFSRDFPPNLAVVENREEATLECCSSVFVVLDID
jgi:hypothetical protein